MMTRRLAPILLACLLLANPTADAAEEVAFAKLTAKQIKARVPGKELTDEVHYVFRFDRHGQLAIVSMGKRIQGKWRIANDALCLVLDPPADETCYQVWMTGKQVELRVADDLPGLTLEGVLQKPAVRQ